MNRKLAINASFLSMDEAHRNRLPHSFVPSRPSRLDKQTPLTSIQFIHNNIKMGNTCSGESFSEQWTSCQGGWERMPDHEKLDRQALLRHLAQKSDDLDWESVLQQAEFLSSDERKRLHQRHLCWKNQLQRKTQHRCKRYDASTSKLAKLPKLTVTKQSSHSSFDEESSAQSWFDVSLGSCQTEESSFDDDLDLDEQASYDTEPVSASSW